MATIRNYDHKVTINVACAAACTEGLLYGINSSGKAVVADRTTGPQAAVGFAVTSITTAQASGNVNVALAPRGIVECVAANIAGGAFTAGATVYLDTAGKYTTTKPSTAADILQPVGVALTTLKVAVNIVPYGLTIQAAGTTTIAP